MPLPPSIKSPAFLGGLGAAGSGVAGIGGWQIYEESYPTADKQLNRRNLTLKPALPTLDADTSKAIHKGNESRYHLNTYECFNRFFPGVTVNHSIVPDDGEFEDPIEKWKGDTGSGDPVGCALMNLSYEGVSDRNKNTKYIFKSEITVKNDKFGWALWAGAKDMGDDDSTPEQGGVKLSQRGLDYHVIFLEEKGSWSIIGGYSWIDFGGASASHNPSTFRIVTPNKEDWASLIRNHKEKTSKEHKEYSGVWIASEDGNEVFQDIEVWYGGDGDKDDTAEILGRTFEGNINEIDFSKEPKIGSVAEGYKNSSGWQLFKGQTRGRGKDAGSTLNKFYEPFKGKKGIWKTSEEHCKRRPYERGLDEQKLKELESLCYSPKTS